VIHKSVACVVKRKAEALEHALYPISSLTEKCGFCVEMYNFYDFLLDILLDMKVNKFQITTCI